MEAIDIWNETGARMCDIELGKEKDETACAALAGRLETWFMKYKASWRSISKEGDLHHISEIVSGMPTFCGEENRTKNRKNPFVNKDEHK